MTVCNKRGGREEKGDGEGMKASGKAVLEESVGTTLRYWAAIQVREEDEDGGQGDKSLVGPDNPAYHTNKARKVLSNNL